MAISIARMGETTEQQPFTAQAQGIRSGLRLPRRDSPSGIGIPMRTPAGKIMMKHAMTLAASGMMQRPGVREPAAGGAASALRHDASEADVAELLHSATVAIVGEVPIDRLWHAVPSYPTLSEVWLRWLEEYGRPA